MLVSEKTRENPLAEFHMVAVGGQLASSVVMNAKETWKAISHWAWSGLEHTTASTPGAI
jgi:hypothetical protein